MTAARRAAVAVLVALERPSTTLTREVDRARATLSDRRDRALLLELTTGALRWRNALDALIASASRRTIDQLDPTVRAALRLGVYQLRYLERVPARAVVHDSVEVVRGLGHARSAGFVNAVLRRLLRDEPAHHLPPRPGPDANREARLAYLTVTLSHPEWLAARWLDRYGFEAAEAWCRFNNAVPSITIRSAGRLSSDELGRALADAGAGAVPARFVRTAFRLPAGSLGRLDAVLRNDVRVQEEASQLVACAVAPEPGHRVLDLCAAPGGKSLMLAAAAGPTGWLVAADRRPRRVSLLAGTLARAGIRPRVVALDAETPLPFRPVFDRVLLDAPCSGLGTLARDPDIKWKRTEADLARFAAMQRRMLARAADVVRPGGRIVYATCSSEPDENHDVVSAFLGEDDRFVAVRAVPAPDVESAGALLDAAGCLVTEPPRHGLEAFFAAVLEHRSPT